MARPGRPKAEGDLVRLAGLPAADLAAHVAEAVMLDCDRQLEDPVQFVLLELARSVGNDQIQLLATSPQIDTASIVRTMRLKAFEARGCTHLPEREWPSERRRVQAELAARLRDRYARILRKKRAGRA